MDLSKFNALQEKVIAWGTDRNFYDPFEGTTPRKQYVKLVEEVGEVAGGLARNNRERLKDSIGDVIVVCIGIVNLYQTGKYPLIINVKPQSIFNEDIADKLKGIMFDVYSLTFDRSDVGALNVIINEMFALERDYGFAFCECLEHAYDQIKDRKGKFVNQIYVKDEDLIQE